MAVAPPKPRDLPLNALRAFEAAARLGSFVAAAQELGVTPGAVTAHVKALEKALGAGLFERSPRGVKLTRLGERVRPAFTSAFDALADASRILQAEAAPRQVHIATLPSLAQLWLSPRLPALRAAAPEISISITAMEEPPNLKRAPYDLCLFYGGEAGGWLARDVIFPVCAPALAARLEGVDSLAAVPCLQDASWADDWPLWASAHAPHVPLRAGPVFSLYALALEEAINGAGVLIGHETLVARQLAAGALVAPFAGRVTLRRGLRLWSDRRPAPRSPAARVRDWLLSSL